MSGAVASLPMYDWPEVTGATDAFWARLRDALRGEGIAAPEALSRDAAHWTHPQLALSQTCGLPYRLGLHARVTLIGAADYGLEDCPPGYYRSAIVVRGDDPRDRLAAFAQAAYAFNDLRSQSGYAALAAAMGRLEAGRGLRTGAHRASIRAVAEGVAKVAAIDAVSWRLAQAWEPAARRLRALAWTPPTPGLPMITAKGRDPAPYARAVAAAIGALDAGVRAALGLRGFVALEPGAYSAA